MKDHAENLPEEKNTKEGVASLAANTKYYKTVGTQTIKKPVSLQKRTATKMSIPYGAIIRINESDYDPNKYPDRHISPYFLASVQNPFEHNDDEIVRNMIDEQFVVQIILVGRYEWINKIEEHTCIRVYPNHQLAMISPPLVDAARLIRQEKRGFLRWFSKTPGKKIIKHHDYPCHNFASMFCIFKFHTEKMKKVVAEAKEIAKHVPKNKKGITVM